ncbi:putative adenylyltransferase/sulfurtransferase MoeZ [compost metagenome]
MFQGAAMGLSAPEIERYSRQLGLPEIGVEGQERLKAAKVLIVGAGGLGSPLATYLAASGVGSLGVVEHDLVTLSNLQRQILFETSDVDRPKVWAAKARLEALNPHVRIRGYEEAFTPSNAERILAGYDLVADASDNFATRFLVNDVSWRLGLPNVQASVYRFEGQLSVFAPGRGPCYRCVFPAPPEAAPRCGDAGVLGVLPGILGTLQATEVLKLILGVGTPLVGRLLMVDALGMCFSEMHVPADPACPLCSGKTSLPPTDLALPSAEGDSDWEVDPEDLERVTPCRYLDVREPSATMRAMPGMRAIPLSRLAAELPHLDPAARYVICCQHGELSRHAVRMLRGAGIREAWSLRGGLRMIGDRWDAVSLPEGRA